MHVWMNNVFGDRQEIKISTQENFAAKRFRCKADPCLTDKI